MLPALKTLPDLATALRGSERRGEGQSRPEIQVILTSFNPTQAALKRAEALAIRLDAGVALVAVQVVPYPLPLDYPPVPLGFIARRFEEILRQSPARSEIRIFLCRDQMEAMKRVLSPNCLVVIGTRKRWWPTREKRLASKLRRAGHEVVLVEME